MAEIQFGHNSPLPRLSRCQVEISQEPRGRSLLLFWLSVISSPSHVFPPPPYGHNDMSSDHCQYWNGELGRLREAGKSWARCQDNYSHTIDLVFGKIFTNFNVLAEIGSLSGNPDGNSRIWWQIQQLVLSGSEKLRKDGGWQEMGDRPREMNVWVGLIQRKPKGKG